MADIAVHQDVSSPASTERVLSNVDVNSLYKGLEKGVVSNGAASDTVNGEKVLPDLQITGLAEEQAKTVAASGVRTHEAGSVTFESAATGDSSRDNAGSYARGRRIFSGGEESSESVPYYSAHGESSDSWNYWRRKGGDEPREIPVLPDERNWWERYRPKPEPKPEPAPEPKPEPAPEPKPEPAPEPLEPPRPEPEVPPKPGDGSMEQARQELERSAAQIEDPAARQRFVQDCADFEKRAKEEGLPVEEVVKTMEATTRLLNSETGAVPEAERINAAQGIMRHAAHPESIDQGAHGTCNVATIENMAFTDRPGQAASMIAEVALTGKWTAPDGKQIKIDAQSLVPGAEERTFPPQDGARSFASQLYQVTALNDLGQRENPPLCFSQRRPASRSDTGEYWTDASGRIVEPFGGLTVGEIADEAERLLPGDNTVIMLDANANWQEGSIIAFNNEKDLTSKLLELKENNDLPIILAVNGSDPVFGGGSPNNGINHVVCISDIDTSTNPPRVKIDNQWGSRNDGWMSVSNLYSGCS